MRSPADLFSLIVCYRSAGEFCCRFEAIVFIHFRSAVITTLVVDQAYSLTVEVQDHTKEEELSEEGIIELATYSNSQYAALSYASF